MSSEPLLWLGAGREVPIELRPDRRSHLSLRADAARGVLRISLHPRTSSAKLMAFLDAHDGWIEARVGRWPTSRPFVVGGMIPLEGRDLRIISAPGQPRRVSTTDHEIVAGGPVEGLSGRVERFLRALALTRLDVETRTLADRIGKPVIRVTVRDTASRWGSCTGKGSINYSWRLILAPPEIRQSVVAHEVAHLVHMNHSQEFWALATDLYDGNMLAARRWLKAHGPGLHWIGRSS